MTTILAQIAPQRSTQYAELAAALAPHELRLCPFGAEIGEIEPLTLGGVDYLRFSLPAEPDASQARELGMLAATSAYFRYYDRLGDVPGPWLRPIETGVQLALPVELLTARRYRGKTNEMFTQFLCNVARASSALANRPWDTLRVFDPLAGGGTTLFAALIRGADAAGVEHTAKDVQSTATYLQGFMRDQGIACKSKRERFKGVGQRWVFTIGKQTVQQCVLAHGDTADSAALISGFRPHLIVADLPYGIQHKGVLTDLLTRGLPVWADLLPPSGAMALAWESSRFPRDEMTAIVESSAALRVLSDPPYDALAHRVDRVIKQRDVIVARPLGSQEG
ncbi:MAG: hypothetical protein JXA09_06810 [Anaerolineae bacterium]|nr:hypothetical protein [Anaerolineae bacterium]